MDPSPGAKRDQVPKELVALWQRAWPSMVQRVGVLREAATALKKNRSDEEGRREAVREAHKLAGSLGTYGLMGGSQIAKNIEGRLEGDEDPGVLVDWLDDQVTALEKILKDADPAGLKQEEGEVPGAVLEGTTQGVFEEPEPGPVNAIRIGEGPLGELLGWVLGVLERLEGDVAQLVRRLGQETQRGVVRGMVLEHADQKAASLMHAARRLERIGLDQAAGQARSLASRFEGPVKGDEVARLAGELLSLNQAVTQIARKRPTQEGDVWVVSSDRGWAGPVAAALQVTGHPVRLVEQLSPEPDSGPLPCGIVVEALAPQEPGLGVSPKVLELLGRVTGIVVVDSPTTRHRIHAGMAGADRVLDRGALPKEVAAAFTERVGTGLAQGCRVLVVDDDRTVLDAVRAILVDSGFDVATVDDPERFWGALEEWAPELVVSDLDMPGIDGAQLCLAMRTDPRWENVPVVFLSSKKDAQNLQRVFEAGADDFVSKPLDPGLFLTRVRARLARHQARMTTGHLDPATRLPTGPPFLEAFDERIESARAAKRNLTVGVIRLDEAARLRHARGYLVVHRFEERLGRLLDVQVHSPSLLGRVEMDRFVVAFDAVDAHDAKAMLDQVINEFHNGDQDGLSHPLEKESEGVDQEARVTASAGIAQVGPHGNNRQELVDAAENARAQAEAAGGSRVFVAGRLDQERVREKVDVLVVDDDPTIGELLLDALAQKGWRVGWEPDPRRAVDRLSGPKRDLSVRAVLLDVNMPYMDGLTVLRLLVERDIVPPAKVVMLTVRSREDEVVHALELGASDHVAKPFSVPVLVSRLSRVLGETS